MFEFVLIQMPTASKEFERELGVLCLQRCRLGRSSRATTAEGGNLGLGRLKLRVEAVIESGRCGHFCLGRMGLRLKTVVKGSVLTLTVRFDAGNGGAMVCASCSMDP